MEIIVKEAAHFVALIAEFVAILVILLGVIKTTIFYFKSPLPWRFVPEAFLKMRVQLGGALSLSLEFLIGADILKTAISPTWSEIGILGSVVVIRTVLNYFLTQELSEGIGKVK
ncbi:putative uncharacterized protein [Waddlia chondrophila 2032/99]|nr:DUF1622 domain-containing protein [Waddlia chondrophila]CCB91316.1 putative uncharacterized protein [Waddlia chondrophila 2032/99]